MIFSHSVSPVLPMDVNNLEESSRLSLDKILNTTPITAMDQPPVIRRNNKRFDVGVAVDVSSCSDDDNSNSEYSNDDDDKKTGVPHEEETRVVSTFENESTEAYFAYEDLKNPFAHGGFRFAARGKYTQGVREGQKCVANWFKKKGRHGTPAAVKTGSNADDLDKNNHLAAASTTSTTPATAMVTCCFDRDIRVAYQALEYVQEWNRQGYFARPVRVTIPEVWTFDVHACGGLAGVPYLQEPFIRKFQKWNCSSGWEDGTGTQCSLAMQALSHFSYHISGGEFLLNDLQGGEYPHCVVITDPVIHSYNDIDFADGDLGPDGIRAFFSNHKCSQFCQSSWLKPKVRRNMCDHCGFTTSDAFSSANPAGAFEMVKSNGRPGAGGTFGRNVVSQSENGNSHHQTEASYAVDDGDWAIARADWSQLLLQRKTKKRSCPPKSISNTPHNTRNKRAAKKTQAMY